MSRNYGLGSRQMNHAGYIALKQAATQGTMAEGSAAANATRFEKYCRFAKSNGINRLEHVTKESVVAYGQGLAESVETKDISAAYAQCLVTAVNSVMTIATKGVWQIVRPTKDCSIPQRSSVRMNPPVSLDKAVSKRAVIEAFSANQHAGHVAELARGFGLRMKEGALIDPTKALKEAFEKGQITAERGTKGGQSRTIPLRAEPQLRKQQIQALRSAAITQNNARSLIPSHLSYSQFLNRGLRDARESLKESGLSGFHDCRAAYACERYEEITGWSAPCAGGRILDRNIDFAARMTIAEELGHHRIDVVAAYIGGR